MPMTRRDAIVSAASVPVLSASTLASAAPGRQGGSTAVRAIDFRVRPPLRSFRPRPPVSGEAQDDTPAMDQFLITMDRAGIEMAVVMGRTAPAPGPFHQFVPNDDIAALVKAYPGKFLGFGSLDVRDPARAIEEVARCKELDFKGIAFDNMLSQPPLYNDDDALMPIYEACVRHGLIIAINASGALGPNLSYSDPAHIQKVAQAFPSHPVVVTHGAWPYSREMVAIALYGMMLRNGNVYFQIDYALMGDKPLPGASDYVDAINLTGVGEGIDVYRRALFGSSFPAIDLELAMTRLSGLEITRPEARQAVMRDNAARLLGIE